MKRKLKKNNFLVIIQARSSSKRLRNKVLKKINNKEIILIIIDKIKKLNLNLIVATSSQKSDDKLAKLLSKKGVNVFRGPLNNVALRYYRCLKINKCDAFIRVTADNPLIDENLIKKAIYTFNKSRLNIITNTLNRTYPKGQSIEVLNSNFFIKNFHKINKKVDKEHVTKYFYENSSKYDIGNLTLAQNYSHLNFSVDNLSDYNKIVKICNDFNSRKIGINLKNLIKYA